MKMRERRMLARTDEIHGILLPGDEVSLIGKGCAGRLNHDWQVEAVPCTSDHLCIATATRLPPNLDNLPLPRGQ